ncbi:MAG: methionyl-tRNA formyltransferase [Endomicrobium sp.]|jgi:methionyl-tRNA formyltransferase|nr:methionyl-tRNA formyltransferase [Endomicrobium sp.]
MNILFFGTSYIAQQFLFELYKNKHNIFVVTLPDKPYYKNVNLVKSYAESHNIPLLQPELFKQNIISQIIKYNVDIGVVIDYGKLIPKKVFDLPHYKIFNIHFSLLPQYRGAAPIQYSLCNGDYETGVTSFYIDQTIDTGDIIIQKKLDIKYNDNAYTLLKKLIPLGIHVMNQTILELVTKNVINLPQHGIPSFTKRIKKSDGFINWHQSAITIYNKFRGLYIWPGLYSIILKGKLTGKRIKFIDMEIYDYVSINSEHDHGTIESIKANKGFIVLCSIGKLLITKIQIEGKPIVSAWNFLQGNQLQIGDKV